MSDRLPWFRCVPGALLGAMAGLQADESLIYVTVLLRIYETGGPIADTARTLARRTGLTERKTASAIESLALAGKITLLSDDRIDSPSTHDELSWQRTARGQKSDAGKSSAEKRSRTKPDTRPKIDARKAAQKTKQNQQPCATVVELPFNDKEEDRDTGRGKPLPNGGRARATFPPDGFAMLWRRYPHKVAEFDAQRAYEEVVASDLVSYADLAAGLERYCQFRPLGQKWCNLGNWFRAGRWSDKPADEPEQAPRASGNGFSQLAYRKAQGDDSAYHDPYARYDRPRASEARGADDLGGAGAHLDDPLEGAA